MLKNTKVLSVEMPEVYVMQCVTFFQPLKNKIKLIWIYDRKKTQFKSNQIDILP